MPRNRESWVLNRLKVHYDADSIARLNDLFTKNVATARYFIEIFPEASNFQNQTDRLFMEVTQSKIDIGKLRGNWCKANSLTPESKTVQGCALGWICAARETQLFFEQLSCPLYASAHVF